MAGEKCKDEVIDEELVEVRNKVSNMLNVQLISCVPMSVRFKYSRTKSKTMDICLQFPSEYPSDLIHLELKSKTLPSKFLEAVPKMIESEREKFIGGKQVLSIARYCMEFLDRNPLCVCSEEIADLKKLLAEDLGDWIKVKQKQMSIEIRVQRRGYYFQVSIEVPEHYCDHRITLKLKETNFPEEFYKFFIGQGNEYARQCVEAPLTKKNKPTREAFVCRPSLYKTCSFMVTQAQRYPSELCGLCDKLCFPDDCKVIEDEAHTSYVNRIYCGHIFHHHCLDLFMKTPPFTGGKKCPKCNSVIHHENWKACEKTREERWAHEQAKDRELEDVIDFLN